MGMFYAYVIVACYIASTALAQIYYPGKCPTAKTQSNHFNKIEGLWYEVARYPTAYLRSTSCIVAYFEPEENGLINEVDAYINVTTGEPGAFFTQIVINHENPSVLQVEFPLPGMNATSHCQIIGTDYNNYIVNYCCTQLHYFHLRYVFILTKVPVPDKSIIHRAYRVIAENALSTTPIKINNRENCSTSSPEWKANTPQGKTGNWKKRHLNYYFSSRVT